VLRQLEAAACGGTVPSYEDFEEDDADAYMPSGLGSKMAELYKKKMGRYSKVVNTFTC